MDCINFPEQNGVLGPPPGVPDTECGSLPVYRDGNICVSCWQLTDQDIEDIIKTRKIYLHLWSGRTQPPCLLATRFLAPRH